MQRRKEGNKPRECSYVFLPTPRIPYNKYTEYPAIAANVSPKIYRSDRETIGAGNIGGTAFF